MKFSANEFSGNQRVVSAWFVLIVVCLCTFVSITLAFFFANDFATSNVNMSGRVEIVAVGAGSDYDSIENGEDSCNLVVNLDPLYNRLIPGMPISLPANVRVMQSTTKPLLRARFEIRITEVLADGESGNDSNDLIGLENNLVTQIDGRIKTSNAWYYYEDEDGGYYYYVGANADKATGDSTILAEVDATTKDKEVDFLNGAITFPGNIDETYSALGVTFKFTFEAIQNFIPNPDTGLQVDNTIANSLRIFKAISES